MLSEGSHRAVSVSTGLGASGNGTEQIGVMFRVSSGPYEGIMVGWRGYFTEKTTQRTIESLRHCGWVGNDLSVFSDTNEEECARLLPSEVEIVVEHEPPMTPDGKAFAKVKWVNKASSSTVSMKEKLDPSKARAFAERLRGACAAVPAQSGAPLVRQVQTPRPGQRRPTQQNHRDEPPPGFFDDADDFPR